MSATAPKTVTTEKRGLILPLWRKIGYGVGDAGMNFSWTFISTFAMFYMTNIVGVGAAAIGTVMLLARLVDGITDVAFGGLLDRTHTKWGQARPWLFWSTFPLAIGTFMIFNVPAGLSETGKVVYFFVMYVLVGAFFYTAANIAYNALVALCTDDARTRVSMGSIRFVCTVIAVLFLTSAIVSIVGAFGGGQRGWTLVSLLYAAVLALLLLISFFSVKEMGVGETAGAMGAAPEAAPESKRPSFLQSLKIVLTNKHFLLVLGIILTCYIGVGAGNGAGIYYATYVLGDANVFGTLMIAATVPSAIALPFMAGIMAKYGMRMVNIVGCVLIVIGDLIAWFGQHSMPMLLIGLVIAGLGSAPFLGSFMAYVAAVGDNIELTTGAAIAGVTFSVSSVGIKVGQGLGGAIVGWALGATGFDGTAANQPDAAVSMMAILYILVPIAFALLRLIAFIPFTVEEENDAARRALSA